MIYEQKDHRNKLCVHNQGKKGYNFIVSSINDGIISLN